MVLTCQETKPLMTHSGETFLTFCDLSATLWRCLLRFLTAGRGGSCPRATDSFSSTPSTSDWTEATGFCLGFFLPWNDMMPWSIKHDNLIIIAERSLQLALQLGFKRLPMRELQHDDSEVLRQKYSLGKNNIHLPTWNQFLFPNEVCFEESPLSNCRSHSWKTAAVDIWHAPTEPDKSFWLWLVLSGKQMGFCFYCCWKSLKKKNITTSN